MKRLSRINIKRAKRQIRVVYEAKSENVAVKVTENSLLVFALSF